MQEAAIHISSINREKIGKSRPDNFIIKFRPTLKVKPDMQHQIGIDRLSMTNTWNNISNDYKNNAIKYSSNSASTWETVTFVNGMFSYSDINDYLQREMRTLLSLVRPDLTSHVLGQQRKMKMHHDKGAKFR